MPAWRPLVAADLPAVSVIAAEVHPDFPEADAVFANKLAIAPQFCFLLEREGENLGYCLAHPYRLGAVPDLDALITLPDSAPDTLYIHDLALLAGARGTGAGGAIVDHLVAAAHPFGALSLVAVNGSVPFWTRMGFAPDTDPNVARQLVGYGPDAAYMIRPAVAPDAR